jgi:hypothetical protein
MTSKRVKISVLMSALVLLLSACNTIATKTNMLSDDDVKTKTAGALGVQPNDVVVVNKHVDGTNTYVAVKANGGEYNCVINGGNLLSFGMTNPPTCAKKGTPLNSSSPFK